MEKVIPTLERWIAASPNASDTIEIAYSKTKGRYLIAKRDIKKNEVIIMEKPYGTTSLSNCLQQLVYQTNTGKSMCAITV